MGSRGSWSGRPARWTRRRRCLRATTSARRTPWTRRRWTSTRSRRAAITKPSTSTTTTKVARCAKRLERSASGGINPRTTSAPRVSSTASANAEIDSRRRAGRSPNGELRRERRRRSVVRKMSKLTRRSNRRGFR